jgi:putative cardiolipin synthase
MKRNRVVQSVLLSLFLSFPALLTGCASLPLEYPRAVSTALSMPEKTGMGQRVQAQAVKHQGKSGFYLLPSGDDAFMARVLAIDQAERTLDLQYYIFRDDLTGKFLLDRLLAAAERGVRVRLLVDDWPQAGKTDWGLAMLQANPNIQVRVFNPLGGLRSFLPSRVLQMVFGPKRLQGRMHNKTFIADNSLAVVGGRNIGDEYFGAQADLNFGDLDIMAIGPITREISAAFDDYWNCALSIPLDALVKGRPSAEDLENTRRFLAENRQEMNNSGYAQKLEEAELSRRVEAGHIPFIWAHGEVLCDDPLKVIREGSDHRKVLAGRRLKSIIEESQSEVLMISPYLVPGERGINWLKGLRDRGVKLEILTNSLASTDVPVAQGGYARYRKQLLQIGVDLYELKPNPSQRRFWDRTRFGSSVGSLHAKTVIVDRRVLFVGSFNLDPRSARLNTENGLVIESRELAAQAAHLFDRSIARANAYRVEISGKSPGSEEGRGLVWITEENGREVRYYKDPMTGFWLRLWVHILSGFAPESML